MTEISPSKGRISSATLALGAAGLLAVAAVGIAIFRSDDTAEPAAGNALAAAAAEGQAGSMDDVIASLSQRLREDPDNHEGWFQLGLAYRGAERFAEAERAFRRAMELAPRNADYTAYLGEALLLKGGDSPPPEAERLFRRTLELQPGNAQARYYLATLKDLNGDHRAAVDELLVLLREAPADAVWEPQVREAVTASRTCGSHTASAGASRSSARSSSTAVR